MASAAVKAVRTEVLPVAVVERCAWTWKPRDSSSRRCGTEILRRSLNLDSRPATALLADSIERVPLSNAAEVMTWLAPHVDRLRRETERIFGAQPSHS
jgi:hypothetical protein